MAKWITSYHKGRDRWRVTLPARWNAGKRKDIYFPTKTAAESFIKSTLQEREQHGALAITPAERQWVQVLRTELDDDLDQLRNVIELWRRTRKVTPTPANEAVDRFLEYRFRDN